MVNTVQASSIGGFPTPGNEKLSATVLRSINKSNTQEDPVTGTSLKNLTIDGGRSPAPALDGFIEKDIQESLVKFEDRERGSLINQRV